MGIREGSVLGQYLQKKRMEKSQRQQMNHVKKQLQLQKEIMDQVEEANGDLERKEMIRKMSKGFLYGN